MKKMGWCQLDWTISTNISSLCSTKSPSSWITSPFAADKTILGLTCYIPDEEMFIYELLIMFGLFPSAEIDIFTLLCLDMYVKFPKWFFYFVAKDCMFIMGRVSRILSFKNIWSMFLQSSSDLTIGLKGGVTLLFIKSSQLNLRNHLCFLISWAFLTRLVGSLSRRPYSKF